MQASPRKVSQASSPLGHPVQNKTRERRAGARFADCAVDLKGVAHARQGPLRVGRVTDSTTECRKPEANGLSASGGRLGDPLGVTAHKQWGGWSLAVVHS